MHPLNPHLFGEHGIAVSFYNGTDVVDGYILDELGQSKFIVTDGSVKKTVVLAQSLAVIDDLASHPDHCTIVVTPHGGSAEHVARIWEFRVRTVEGHDYNWHLGASVNNSAVIARYS
jgi:hypothetical protein